MTTTAAPAFDLIDAATAPILRTYQGRPVREIYRAIRVSRKPDRWRVFRVTDGRPSSFGERSKLMAEKEALGFNLIASAPHHCQGLVVCPMDASYPPVTCLTMLEPYTVCPREHVQWPIKTA
jgi:hypothetical protein